MNAKAARRLVPAVTVAILASIAGGVAPLATFAATPPACPQIATVVTCTYFSGDNVFAVPGGVTSIHVVAVGAPGGTLRWNKVLSGGHGAVVSADLAVSPGQTLRAVVAGSPSSSQGGFNGGGAGGQLGPSTSVECGGSAGGGGASDIRTTANAVSRLLVAGGGGGAGCETTPGLVEGGQSGGDAGTSGLTGISFGSLQGGGGGGAGCEQPGQVDCGLGGAGGFGATDAGEDGALAIGGHGGASGLAPGGGGGGGYYGGGGGGGAASSPAIGDSAMGGGGGGGSSLVPVGGALAIDTTGIPKIEISYSVPALPAGPHAQLAPATLDLGDVVVGQQAAQQGVTLTSTGAGDLNISSIGFAGPADGFVVRGNDCGTLLPSQWTCQIFVGFSTVSVGAHTATLQVQDDAADSPQTVTLTANGTGGSGPLASVNPASLDFGNVAVGAASAPGTVMVTNVGTIPMFVDPILELPANGFAATSDCSAPIDPGNSCNISITFTPPALGSASGQLHIFGPIDEATVPLTGIGVPPAPPQASVSPASLSFGNVRVGTPSTSQLVTVSAAPGTSALHIGQLGTTGTNSADFGVGSDHCSNTTLTAGTSCTALVTFVPQARGSRTATLQVPDDAADSPQTVDFSGTGVAPVGQVTPASIDFGTVNVGTTSAHRTVTVTNTGDTGQSLVLTSETITGSNASEFAFAGDTCITNFIAAGSSCTIDLTFTPAAAGPRSATLTISDNGIGSPHTVSLSGTGGTPSADLAVSISASPNPVRTGQKVSYTITVLNAGTSTAMGIVINDSLSSQSTFVSATISGGTCVTPVKGASGVVSCSLASLASGSTKPVQIVVTVIAKKTSITNSVTVSAVTADPNLGNNTASITTRLK